jgi:hypothetical protein
MDREHAWLSAGAEVTGEKDFARDEIWDQGK